ncbi:glycosyltransferase [Phototrophicus methaneseepsis]|uniref:Glycosyltransferase n=1 Tax=Phototrophicus methaneseepsis TaxID=2710758 RepID=A0A7S8IDH6_9CHLR|nr:glycosyltransferase [Phototrophicus methaneseepsis]QPC80803.1 glycosyltransferase [Phototrophicus methaneseepsis]
MRILIITAALPYPPASGGALRAYGIIEGLSQAGHDITLMSFHDETSPEVTPLSALCRQVVTLPSPHRSRTDRVRNLLFTSQADIARRLYSPQFEQKLLELLAQESYDIVQFEGIEVACYLPATKQASNAAIIFDTFNAEAELQRVIAQVDRATIRTWPKAVYSWIQSQRIAAYEGNLCRLADAVIAVSPEDAALLAAYQPQRAVAIVPSGINTDRYLESSETIDLGHNSLIFTGKMDYRPNVDAMMWFSETVLPQLEDVNLTIVGQKPHPQLQALLDQDNIKLTGWVDSVLPYLHSADVYIAPLRMGSGTRLKILEAMASGCAIVATDLAASGLLGEARAALWIADDPSSFAEAIRTLLADEEKRTTLGKAARIAVQQHYDWRVLIPRLLTVYKELGLG